MPLMFARREQRYACRRLRNDQSHHATNYPPESRSKPPGLESLLVNMDSVLGAIQMEPRMVRSLVAPALMPAKSTAYISGTIFG